MPGSMHQLVNDSQQEVQRTKAQNEKAYDLYENAWKGTTSKLALTDDHATLLMQAGCKRRQ